MKNAERTYYLSPSYRAMIYIVILPLVILIINSCYKLIVNPQQDVWTQVFITVLTFFVTAAYLRMPYLIRVEGESTLVFKSIFSEKKIEAADLISLSSSNKMAIFTHKGGKIRMVNRIRNMQELVKFIKKINSQFSTADYKYTV